MGNARIAYVDIDREAAARYGLTADDVDTALYNAFGQRLISTIYTQSTSTASCLRWVSSSGMISMPSRISI